MDGQGNLEKTWKVGEKSGNLKINSYGRQSPENLQSTLDVSNTCISKFWDLSKNIHVV